MLEVIKTNIIPFIISVIVSVITVLITEWIKRKGNLKIYVIDYKEKYLAYDSKNRCDITEDTYTSDTKAVKVSITMDIYNNTSVPKIMRNIKLKIGNNDKIIVKDKDTENFNHSMYHIDELNNLNINPFTVTRKTITIGLNRENYIKARKYYLIYRNSNNRLKKVKFERLVKEVND